MESTLGNLDSTLGAGTASSLDCPDGDWPEIAMALFFLESAANERGLVGRSDVDIVLRELYGCRHHKASAPILSALQEGNFIALADRTSKMKPQNDRYAVTVKGKALVRNNLRALQAWPLFQAKLLHWKQEQGSLSERQAEERRIASEIAALQGRHAHIQQAIGSAWLGERIFQQASERLLKYEKEGSAGGALD